MSRAMLEPWIIGKFGDLIGVLFAWWARVMRMGWSDWLMFALALTVGVLGLVPGALNLMGHNHAGDIVATCAVAVVVFLSLLHLRPLPHPVGEGNATCEVCGTFCSMFATSGDVQSCALG